MNSTPSTQYPLKVENLTVHQGSYLAVRDVPWIVTRNRYSCSSNGAGKSTLVQAILNLIGEQVARLKYFGRPLERLDISVINWAICPKILSLIAAFRFRLRNWCTRMGEKAGKNYRAIAFMKDHQNRETSSDRPLTKRVGAAHLRQQAIGTLMEDWNGVTLPL